MVGRLYRSVQSGIRTGLVSGAESFFVIFAGLRARLSNQLRLGALITLSCGHSVGLKSLSPIASFLAAFVRPCELEVAAMSSLAENILRQVIARIPNLKMIEPPKALANHHQLVFALERTDMQEGQDWCTAPNSQEGRQGFWRRS